MKKLWERFKTFNNDKYGMLITTCWVVLLACLVIKLFGGNWFGLWWENEKFISFCNYVENVQWLKMTIACLIYLISGYFIISVILNEKMKPKHFLVFYPIMIAKSIIGWYSYVVAFIIDCFVLIVLPIIFNRNWKRTLICFFVIAGLQVLTIVLRNVSFEFNNANTLIQNYLIQVDYYVMVILWFLYTFKRKEER